jgi:hypothetical protein
VQAYIFASASQQAGAYEGQIINMILIYSPRIKKEWAAQC